MSQTICSDYKDKLNIKITNEKKLILNNIK